MGNRPENLPTGAYYVLLLCDADDREQRFVGEMGKIVVAGVERTPEDLMRWLAVERQTTGVRLAFSFEPLVQPVPEPER